MCGPWLIFLPVAGIFVAIAIWRSEWARSRDLFGYGEGFAILGFFLGLVAMWAYLIMFCMPPEKKRVGLADPPERVGLSGDCYVL